MAINGQLIYLRQMELSDMNIYQEMLNDETIASDVVGWSFPVSMSEQVDWFHKVINDPLNKRFSIVMKSTNKVVGMVTLQSIDWHNRSAFHGIKLHTSCPKGKGIGTDAVRALMRYAFEEVNLNRLDGCWLDYNIASKKLYEKCGWYAEGTKKEAIFKNGKYHDLIIAGITKKDYLEKNKLAEL